MRIDRTRILVLNYNGRALLAECLPSVIEAAAAAPVPCAVSVVDNGSTDGSVDWLSVQYPTVQVVRSPNDGLASFNHAVAACEEPAVVLLNNDVKLDRDAIGPLLDALKTHDDALFAAPQCWTFDESTYEGMRTRVRMRFGLVQGLCRVPGFERHTQTPGLTASSGPVLAVDRRRFLAIGGYDRLYHPGRIEDLDLGFRGWMQGWRGYYAPRSRTYHKGFASFGPAFGRSGCDHLATRNSLLFAWKNLGGRRLAAHVAWIPVRLGWALARGRLEFARALADALKRLSMALASRRAASVGRRVWTSRQEKFFREFGW